MTGVLDNGELGLTGRWTSSLEVQGSDVPVVDNVILLETPHRSGGVVGRTEAVAPDGEPNLTLNLIHVRNLLEGRWSGWVPGAVPPRVVGEAVLMLTGEGDQLGGSVDYMQGGAPTTASLRLTRNPLGGVSPASTADPDPTPPSGYTA